MINSVDDEFKVGYTLIQKKKQVRVSIMNLLFLYAYEFLVMFIPFIIVFGIFSRYYRVKDAGIPKTALGLIVIFALYIMGVYHFTGSGTIREYILHGFRINRFMVNLIPFSREIDVNAYVLNVILFVPLGFLIPVVWEKGRRFWYIFRTGIGLSLIIEASQLLNNRSFDVDDLILNTVGGIIGFLVFMIVNKCTKSKIEMKNVPVSFLVICVLIPFAARFFLYNEMGFANIIYGF